MKQWPESLQKMETVSTCPQVWTRRMMKNWTTSLRCRSNPGEANRCRALELRRSQVRDSRSKGCRIEVHCSWISFGGECLTGKSWIGATKTCRSFTMSQRNLQNEMDATGAVLEII